MSTESSIHTLKPRSISVATASSFIIVVSVGFFGLLMVCVGSSSYYRQRLARRDGVVTTSTAEAGAPKTRPQLWDVFPTELKPGHNSLHDCDWEKLQPLAVKLKGEQTGEGAVDMAEKAAATEWTPRSRLATWLRLSSAHASGSSPLMTAVPPASSSAIVPVEVEVAILISMPSAHSPRQSASNTGASQTEQGSHWTAGCAVGTSKVSYRGNAEGLVL